jgi:hypothetical protein
MAVEFAHFTAEEEAHVDRIVERAEELFERTGVERESLDIQMDLSATHAKCPLRLSEFAEADDFNFAHDIWGIYRHLNRKTGELEDSFLPRFAQPDAPEVPSGDGFLELTREG